MKIALIYTARSGSSSIFKYFEKLKPNYICYNEPWFEWSKEKRYDGNTDYNELIKNDNLFIKSTLSTLPCSLDTIISDFDKVVFLLRKDFESQLESQILVNRERTYLNHTQRKYNIYSISQSEIEQYTALIHTNTHKITTTSNTHNIPLFYYEDLYYGDFQPLFDELELEYNDLYYKEFLDITNKYRIGDVIVKKTNTLI
jgi:hypothetical protein